MGLGEREGGRVEGVGGGWSHSAWLADWGLGCLDGWSVGRVGWLTHPQPCPGVRDRAD